MATSLAAAVIAATASASVDHHPRTVFLGLPKGGTTSFHFLMGSLGVPSFHVGGAGYMDTNPSMWSQVRLANARACSSSAGAGAKWPAAFTDRVASERRMTMATTSHLRAPPRLEPQRFSRVSASAAADRPLVTCRGAAAYNAALHLIGDDHIFCMVNASGYRAFADDPWGLMFPYIDEVAPDTRFVLWERDPKAWAASAVRFFDDDRDWDWLRFFYGACNMTTAFQAHLERVARAHYSAVKAHFHGPKAPPSRRNRLLLVDYSDPNAGKQVCAFALGAQEGAGASLRGHRRHGQGDARRAAQR